MKIAYIIDLDGTLYDNSHRQHLIPADRNNTAGWVPFNAACAKDILRKEVANLVRAVAAEGGDVIFLTARGEDAREPTFNRLHQDFSFAYSSDLIMRQMNDHRSAAEFKSSFISGLKSEFSVYRDHTLVAIEDDPAVVDAMRALGVTVLHIDSKCCTVEKPHHNGMMQLSNELADMKRRYAELEEVIQQRNGECSWRQRESYDLAVIVKSLIFNLRKTGAGESAIFTAEDFLKRHGLQDAVLSFSSRPSGELSGNTEQLDTVPGNCSFLSPDSIGEEMKRIYSDGHQVIGYELRGEQYSVVVGSAWNVAMASFRAELKARIAEAEGAKIYGNRIDDSLPSPVSLKEVDTAPAQFESLAGESVSESYKLNDPVIPDGWVACSERMPDPESKFRVCVYTPTPHEDLRFRFVPASLFKSVCRDATHWQYMLPPAAPQQGGNCG